MILEVLVHHNVIVPAALPWELRRALLDQAVLAEIARDGRVESYGDLHAVIVYGRPVDHLHHACLTAATCWAWSLVWLLCTVSGGERRTILYVGPWGEVWRT